MQGDRAGLCVTKLDAAVLERGLACSPGSVPTFSGAIAAVEKIRWGLQQRLPMPTCGSTCRWCGINLGHQDRQDRDGDWQASGHAGVGAAARQAFRCGLRP